MHYAFQLQWAADYDAVRNILYDENLLDIHVVPGMTVPTDLTVGLALRTRQPITGIEVEYPQATVVKSISKGSLPDTQVYTLRFTRLGENPSRLRSAKD